MVGLFHTGVLQAPSYALIRIGRGLGPCLSAHVFTSAPQNMHTHTIDKKEKRKNCLPVFPKIVMRVLLDSGVRFNCIES